MTQRSLVGLIGLLFVMIMWARDGEAAELNVTASTASGCATTDYVAQAQQLGLSATGFSPGSTVNLEFWCCNERLTLPPATADGSGNFTAIVSVPTITSGWPVYPAPAGIIAMNSTAPPVVRTAFFLMGPPGALVDSDGDGLPDFCDNCPMISNSSQLDNDVDSVGDSCDVWPSDPTNDADGDNQSEVDREVNPECPETALNDQDNDDVCDDVDNCPGQTNRDQIDSDGNGVGDRCQTSPSCSDGIDNDRDGLTDFPQDRGCTSAADKSETEVTLECDDGKDNDGDGLIDFNAALEEGDPGCGLWWGAAVAEATECDDDLDNDGDGNYDWDGRNGRFAADAECSVFGFGTSETVPEPSVVLGLAMGVVLVSRMGSRRRGQRLGIRERR